MIAYAFGAAIVLCLIRAILGPTFADRVIAVDAASILAIALMCHLAVYYGLYKLVDTAIVYAILSFIGTIAISLYKKGELK